MISSDLQTSSHADTQGTPSRTSGRRVLPAHFALLASVLLAAAPAAAQVEMNTAGTCAMGSDDLGVRYTNKTLDPWEMRGYSMNIGTGRVRGDFFLQAAGGYLVPPGGVGMINFQSCGGNTGKVFNQQLEAKVGSCNEPDPPKEPQSLACEEISNPAAIFYKADQCLVDGLGVDRGDGYGGFIDSWQGQTQIQVAIPSGTVNMGGTPVRFDPASMGGPFYMMSMAALQEYLYVDMQFLLAMAGSTTGAGLVDASNTSLYQSPPNTGNDNSPYGSFKVTYLTATGRLYGDYPKYFAGSPDINKLVATNGSGPTLANSPQQLNSGFLAAMNLWWLFDGLKSAQDLCFRQYLKEATDKAAGLKLMLGGYHIGPNAVDNGTGEPKDYATHVLPTTNATLLGAADVTPYMKKFVWGGPSGPDYNNHNYITRTFSVLNQMLAANANSAACAKAQPVYDAGIKLKDVQELFFGQGGTAATQGNGGLLWHFNIPAASRQALWNDLICAFDKLKGKAPGRAADEISFRYDYLTVLRVARQHFSGYVNKHADRPTPGSTYSSEWSIWVNARSKNPCTRSTQDTQWPSLALTDTSLRKGDKVEKSASDDKGLKSREFTTDLAWRIWQPTDANFAVPMTLTGTQRLWYRVTDSCGNSTIQEVPWKDTPPLPILPAPTATPPGGEYTKAQSVVLSLPDSVKAAAIHYTTDGTPPTTSSPRYAGPIPVASNLTIKAIAVLDGYQKSPQLIANYVINIPPNAPVKSWYLDQNGDGSIETVIITFAEALVAAPDKLAFTIQDERGQNASRTVQGAQIAFDGGNTRVKVTLAEPFPYGITSVANAATSGQTFAQANIPLASATFAVEDSVAPVILKAEVKEPDAANPRKRVEIAYSETVDLGTAPARPLSYRREDGTAVAAGAVVVGATVRPTPLTAVFTLDSTEWQPVVGDSAAIAAPGGETRDRFGRAPAVELFRRLEGNPPATKPVALYVTYPNGSPDKPSSAAPSAVQALQLFPIGSDFRPLPDGAPGRCGACDPGLPTRPTGPVLTAELPLQGDYEFRLFNNLGEFLVKVAGSLTAEDLKRLENRNDATGQRYIARFVWTGRDAKGAQAGTGAYILEGTFKFPRNPKTGAPPSVQTKRIRFGLVR